jgi:hypothetical protein
MERLSAQVMARRSRNRQEGRRAKEGKAVEIGRVRLNRFRSPVTLIMVALSSEKTMPLRWIRSGRLGLILTFAIGSSPTSISRAMQKSRGTSW